ncbi:NAD(P)/FAD-dependent oxidoreductase [Williamsia serinedens]|uniref:3-phenylpropionate/trans-cinnamate dioxygenase ferredoxin reductase subunit n=1 Tax=Williamsia serinedens TaxID=391736 RepID=A0ABT1H062_9NOCA|nr:3-phenylpropionate/trans-cinnamate dioxygenase ferredoxin reductase subunit [Williamsia serinedens]
MLIVGSSQAGVQLAVSLRALGYADPVTLLGDEDHRPYQRPALSKEFLQDAVGKESLIFRSAEYWRDNGIDVVKGHRIDTVATRADGSGLATARDGREFSFDRLALTVGARARRLSVPGADLDGVLYLRTADDALALKARVPEVRRAVVIGGGFIGLETAASLHTLGIEVTVIEFADRLVARAVGAATSDFLFRHHTDAGIDIRLGTAVEQVVGRDGQVSGVIAGGVEIPADVVLVGIGVIPNTALAEQMGLAVDDGIVVDDHAVTSDGHTLAVGDCANLPDPSPGAPAGRRVRFESVNHAIEQAKVAAYAAVGRSQEYASVPWFWSTQGVLKLQIAGVSGGHDTVVDRSAPDPRKHSVLYYRGDRLVAAECVNTPLDFIAVKKALAQQISLPPATVTDPATPLSAVLAAASGRKAS